jgi:endo-1,4-beta-xylanase
MKNLLIYRAFLTGSLALAMLTGCKNKGEIRMPVKALKDIADFPIGAAISLRNLLSDDSLLQIELMHFNSITARSEMKMNRILPAEGQYFWDLADSMADFAKKYDQRLFGHNLIWHSSTPAWVEEKAAEDSAWLDSFMKDYIHTYVGRYRGKVDGWDVVNEGMNTFGGGYRETMWYNVLGKAYIANAFRYAHEADPDALLFYNDFNIERDTAKLNSVLAMINELKNDGVPISGLGYQMHLRMDIPDSIIAYTLRKGAETGLMIHLSEVDIIFNTHNDSRGGGVQTIHEMNDSLLNAQAEKYRNLATLYRTIVPPAQQYGITFWGYSDRNTWIRGFFNIMDWPCLWDDDLQPKPAYYGFLEGLSAKTAP